MSILNDRSQTVDFRLPLTTDKTNQAYFAPIYIPEYQSQTAACLGSWNERMTFL